MSVYELMRMHVCLVDPTYLYTCDRRLWLRRPFLTVRRGEEHGQGPDSLAQPDERYQDWFWYTVVSPIVVEVQAEDRPRRSAGSGFCAGGVYHEGVLVGNGAATKSQRSVTSCFKPGAPHVPDFGSIGGPLSRLLMQTHRRQRAMLRETCSTASWGGRAVAPEACHGGTRAPPHPRSLRPAGNVGAVALGAARPGAVPLSWQTPSTATGRADALRRPSIGGWAQCHLGWLRPVPGAGRGCRRLAAGSPAPLVGRLCLVPP